MRPHRGAGGQPQNAPLWKWARWWALSQFSRRAFVTENDIVVDNLSLIVLRACHLAHSRDAFRMRSAVWSRARRLRAVSQTAPGRLWASCSPVLRPGRGVLPLDWDRRGRVTPAGPESQEAWPGAEPRCESPGESRCGAPEGERAPQADELRRPRTLVCGAHPRPRCRRTATCVGAARTNSFAPFGASLPRLFRGTESNRPRTLTRRENDPCYPSGIARGE